MKKKTLILLSCFIVIIQLTFGIPLIANTAPEKLNTVLVNDIVKTSFQHWKELEHGKSFPILAEWLELNFSIVSEDGTILMYSDSAAPASLNEAIENRDTIVDIGDTAHPVGKLLIRNPYPEQSKSRGQIILIILLIGLAAESALIYLYMHHLERFILKPFGKLQDFAVHVAEGDLDFPLEMDRENVFGAFTESFDLMREQLKAARENERKANQSKKELVAQLSHDIKTPVASIQAVSELMLVSAKEDKEISRLCVIQEKTGQIDFLISDLFHATLEELQELKVIPIQQSSLILTEMLREADYQNKADIPAVLECILIFDRLRLKQVFDNIFSNSYKYADTPIQVSFRYDEDCLFINILDFGQGVSDEECALLFEKYYRGKNAEGKNGAGLGLFISHYILQQMGGQIFCTNTADGFEVTVSLKLA